MGGGRDFDVRVWGAEGGGNSGQWDEAEG